MLRDIVNFLAIRDIRNLTKGQGAGEVGEEWKSLQQGWKALQPGETGAARFSTPLQPAAVLCEIQKLRDTVCKKF